MIRQNFDPPAVVSSPPPPEFAPMTRSERLSKYLVGLADFESVMPPLATATATAGISGLETGKVSAPEYDLVVIGSGPAGQKGAIAAAKARKRVAVIDRTGMIGGVSVHTGTIPSKTVREAIFQLSGLAVSALYGAGSRGRVDISVENVSSRVK